MDESWRTTEDRVVNAYHRATVAKSRLGNGMTWGQLPSTEKLWKFGLMGYWHFESIEPPPSPLFVYAADAWTPAMDPMLFYQTHYEGLTRGQLREINEPLYDRMRRDRTLSKIPVSERHKKRLQNGWTPGKHAMNPELRVV